MSYKQVFMWGALNHKQLFCHHNLLCIRAPDLPYSLPHFSSLGEKNKAAACDFLLVLMQNSLLLSATAHFDTALCFLPLWCSAGSKALLGPASIAAAISCSYASDSSSALYGYKVTRPERTVFTRMIGLF